ncbi:MAG: PD-(D/E)XK nuclease family protein [Clostridia bacterium]
MSVKLIKSNTYEQAFVGVLRELKLHQSEGRNVVIVPDKFSLSLERNILSKLDISGSFNIEVMSFTRFAAKSLKNRIKRCLTPEGSVMLLKRAVTLVEDKLTVYRKAATQNGFAREMYAVLTSVRNSGLSPTSLELTELPLSDSRLKQKLIDIALIYNKYLVLLEGRHSDSSTRLQSFADFLPQMNGISETNIYICDFSEFTSPQYDIIEKLIANARRVTFGFATQCADAPNSRLYSPRAVNKIICLCKLHSQKVEILSNKEILLPYKKAICDNLFSYANSKPVEIKGEIQLRVAPNINSEVENVAKNIRWLIVEKGYRYCDISLVVGDMDDYIAPIQNIFSRFEIPYFIDKKEYFYEQPSVRFLVSALRVAEQNFRVSAILDFIKNPLFYFDEDGINSVFLFENYCLKYSINAAILPFTQGEEAEIENAKKVIDKVNKFVQPFVDKPKDKVSSYIGAVEKFLSVSGFFDLIERLEEGKSEVFVRVNRQIEGKLGEILFEMNLTLGEQETSLFSFIQLIEGVFSNVKVALVPLYVDSVFVGEIKESRYDDVKAMFMLGANEGKIPLTVGDTAVIASKEEEALVNAGLSLCPTKKENNIGNLFYLTQLLLKHKNMLYISYSESNGITKILPSELLTQLSSLFSEQGNPLEIKPILDEQFIDNSTLTSAERANLYAYKFSTLKNTYYELLGNVANEAPIPVNMQPYNAAYSLLTDFQKMKINKYLVPMDNIKKINDSSTLLHKNTFSASRLEKYFSCPYRYYLSYGLSLLQRSEGELKSRDTGSIIHAVLDKFLKTKLYLSATADEVDNFSNHTIDNLVCDDIYKSFNANIFKSAFNRLKHDVSLICQGVQRQIANSDFKPYFTELKVGEKSKGDDCDGFSVNVNKCSFTLKGAIDRIDKFEDNFTIIDYKSSEKKLTANKIFNGECIQPVLYMISVKKSGIGTFPCGLIYMPVTVGFKKINDERFKMSGIVTSNIELLSKMDNGLLESSKSKVFPVSINKDGTLGKSSYTLSCEDFDEIGKYVESLTQQAIKEILDGNISASPLEKVCNFCDFKSICEFDSNARYVRKTFPKISFVDFKKLNNGEYIESDCEVLDDD